MPILDIRDLELKDKRIFIRADLNVPMHNGKITGHQRITAVLPTVKTCLDAGAKVMLVSHVGRPSEGVYDEKLSLKPVNDYISNELGKPIRLIKNWINEPFTLNSNELVLLENCRFNNGEMINDEKLSKKMAKLCDIFVMEAFGTAHRTQATTYGIAQYADVACGGILLIEEIKAIKKSLVNPKKPLVALVGGSKVSTKLTILESLANHVEQLIVGGGIANSFILATGHSVGNSVCEENIVDTAQELIFSMKKKNTAIAIPTDVIVAKEFHAEAKGTVKDIVDIKPNDMILDLGPKSIDKLCKIISNAGTIVWNGPVGVFEFPAFAEGTRRISQAIADSTAFSIAGGGDTLSAIDSFGLQDKISYISTGGGAFLELLESKTLASVAILEERYNG